MWKLQITVIQADGTEYPFVVDVGATSEAEAETELANLNTSITTQIDAGKTLITWVNPLGNRVSYFNTCHISIVLVETYFDA